VPLGRVLLRGERADHEQLRYQALDEQGFVRGKGRVWDPVQTSIDLPRGTYTLKVTDAAGATVLEQPITVGEQPVIVQVPPG
jgi:hypothetical protein